MGKGGKPVHDDSNRGHTIRDWEGSCYVDSKRLVGFVWGGEGERVAARERSWFFVLLATVTGPDIGLEVLVHLRPPKEMGSIGVAFAVTKVSEAFMNCL